MLGNTNKWEKKIESWRRERDWKIFFHQFVAINDSIHTLTIAKNHRRYCFSVWNLDFPFADKFNWFGNIAIFICHMRWRRLRRQQQQQRQQRHDETLNIVCKCPSIVHTQRATHTNVQPQSISREYQCTIHIVWVQSPLWPLFFRLFLKFQIVTKCKQQVRHETARD